MGLVDDPANYLSVIFNAIQLIFDLLKTLIIKVYEIGNDIVKILWDYIYFFFQNFPADNSKRLIVLSSILFLLLLGLIIVFSATPFSKGGITTTNKIITLDASISAGSGSIQGLKNESKDAGGISEINQTINNTQPRLQLCYSDKDCEVLVEGEIRSTKCCDVDKYNGYSCAGHCLVEEGYGYDACTHPNACYFYNDNKTFDKFAGKDKNRCDQELNANGYCQRRNSNVNGTIDQMTYCCIPPKGSKYSPCYGYCLKKDSSYNCNDITACYGQNTPIVTLVTGEDNNGGL